MSPKGIDRWTMIVDGSMHVIGHDEGFDRVLGRPADDDEDALSIISTLVGDDGLEVLEENVLGTISDGDRRTFTLDDEMLEVARMDIGDVHCAIISHFEDAPSCQSRTLERLVLMNSALARINASDRLDDVLDTILDVALEITGYDKGGVYICQGTDAHLRTTRNIPSGPLPNVRTGDLTRHPLHDLVKHGRTFFIPDYLDVAPTMAEALEARSVIIVPLLDDEGAIRVLINLASSEPESEDKEAIRILEGICGHLSSAIERVAIGEQVIRERQNLTSLIRDIGFMVFIVGNDGRVRYVNPAVTDATGWERSEIVGRPLIELHPPDLRGIASYNIDKMVGDPDFVCRLPIVKRDGSLLHIESRIIRGEWDGEGVLIGVSQDKSEMISTTDALRNANRNLSLCTSITRHDILNKVLVIEGYHSMLRDEVHDGDAATMVRGIGDAAKAIRRMIEFTREYEKLGRSEPVWVDVNKAVWGSMLSTPGHVTIEVDCQMEVMADELFSRALHNLIENSVIHGGPSLSRISIMCIVDDVGARIVYEDDGVGIPYDDKTAIFEKGYGRVHGLGLFLCREVLDVTGMTIIEDGVPGEGARFIVHLPEGGYRQPSK